MAARLFCLVIVALGVSPAVGEDNSRRGLDPSKAVVGHWVTESGKTHYYFDKGVLIMVDEGKEMRMTYEQVSENKDDHSLHLKIKTATGGHEKTLRFANTRTSLLETVTVSVGDRKISINTVWKYVDGKAEPK